MRFVWHTKSFRIGRRRSGGRGVVPLLAVLAALVVAAPTLGQSATPVGTPDPTVTAVASAVDYLLDQQGEDGGFVGLGDGSDPGTTADAIVALEAAEYRGVDIEPALGEAVSYLEDQTADYAAIGPGQAAKLALAAVAAGREPTVFGGVDLLAAMTGDGSGTPVASPAVPGAFGDDLYDHALVLLALAAVNEPAPEEAIALLRDRQAENGGWAYDSGDDPAAADSNTTALIIQALVATGHGDEPMVEAGLGYLRSVETTLGQFAFQFQAAEPLVADANSTALAVQAIVATGGDPSSADEWSNAARGLTAFQNAGGAFRYQDATPADNLLATLQAIPALSGIPLPVGIACDEEAPAATTGATPIIALPAPGRGQVACVAVEAA